MGAVFGLALDALVAAVGEGDAACPSPMTCPMGNQTCHRSGHSRVFQRHGQHFTFVRRGLATHTYILGLQVGMLYQLWGLTYVNITYFGLFGAPGIHPWPTRRPDKLRITLNQTWLRPGKSCDNAATVVLGTMLCSLEGCS